jgi:hypothetical protein
MELSEPETDIRYQVPKLRMCRAMHSVTESCGLAFKHRDTFHLSSFGLYEPSVITPTSQDWKHEIN